MRSPIRRFAAVRVPTCLGLANPVNVLEPLVDPLMAPPVWQSIAAA